MLEDDGDIEMQIESDDDSEGEESGAVKLSTMESRIGISSAVSAASAAAQSKRDNIQVQDMDEESSEDEESAAAANKIQPSVAPLLPPTHDKVVIKKYDPKQAQKPVVKPPPTDEFLISPITGERIPASKVAEHMRIGLLDPRWVEQRDKHSVDKLNQDNVCIFSFIIFRHLSSNKILRVIPFRCTLQVLLSRRVLNNWLNVVPIFLVLVMRKQ